MKTVLVLPLILNRRWVFKTRNVFLRRGVRAPISSVLGDVIFFIYSRSVRTLRATSL